MSTNGWRQLIRQRPLIALLWGSLLLLEMAAAALLGGVLVFGWLNQGFGWATYLTAGGLAVLVGWGRWRQRRLSWQGERVAARRLHRRLTWPLLAALLILVVVSIVELLANGLLGLSQIRQAEVQRLMTALERNYPYFESKQIDWAELRADYQPQLLAAGSEQEFFRLLDDFLAEFNDLHTGVLDPSPLANWRGFLAVRNLEGQAVVSAVRSGLEEPGLQPGAVILERNGQSIGQFVDSLPLSLRSSSTAWFTESNAYGLVGMSPVDDPLQLTYRGVDQLVHQVTLTWSDQLSQSGSTYSRITWRRLESGVGLIQVNSLNGDLAFIRDFDQALDSLADAPGIILDLRNNGGGNSLLGDAIAGRFLSEHFIYGQEYYRQRLPWRAWATRADYAVRPRGSTYSGPLVVLIGPDTVSSAEMLTVALGDSDRAVLVGRTTAGGSGNPIGFSIAGGQVRFSTGDFRRNDGTPIEGIGIQPDVSVQWTAVDLQQGIDPDLAAAEQQIGAR